ncbi:MAG TPA: universal stress protein [Gaiellaceae bacterium]|nr:universal stress protein [Gaiellaceae bacterium]
MSGFIVVGIDGSDGSERALEWAAAEAHTRNASLKLVTAWHLPPMVYGGMGWTGIDPGVITELREFTEKRLEETCKKHSESLDGLDVERLVSEDAAASALLDAAEGADLLVVGTRGHGGFSGLLLGSVSQQCAHHSPCPIVIVPSTQPAGT